MEAKRPVVISLLGALLLISSIIQLSYAYTTNQKSFTIDYDNDTFLKDGKPFRYISGSIHYSRVPFYYWQDRLAKMRYAGLDAIQVYVPWNVHETSPGVYDFDGQNDLESFLELAHNLDLLVILRPGPYICGEWEFGGFPPWILKKNASIVLRSMDPGYIEPVDRWLSVLMPKMQRLLYSNGGPIIMVQVENEYGSYFACDSNYLEHLRVAFRKYLGDDVVLFSTDGAGLNYLKCGVHKGIYPTVDFGPGYNASIYFKFMRDVQPNGPLVNSEFYPGYLDHWGVPHAHTATQKVIDYLVGVLDMNASVNMYMFEGGTNFGYWNGADPGFAVCPTSYDYDAPLSEAGDVTPKYDALRTLISKYKPMPPGIDPPVNSTKYAYGNLMMEFHSTVLDALSTIGSRVVNSLYPLSMEEIDQGYGFILYRHKLQKTYKGAQLNTTGIRDRGYVMLDGKPLGMFYRTAVTSLDLDGVQGQMLDILVENQGRLNYGNELNQRKGLISNVTVDGATLDTWVIHPLDLEKVFVEQVWKSTTLTFRSSPKKTAFKQGTLATPSIYFGRFLLPDTMKVAADTFLQMYGWTKGQAFINGFNLGRYWPMKGPQVTLYLPGGALKPYPQENTLVMLELEQAPCDTGMGGGEDKCIVQFVDVPLINGNVTVSTGRPDVDKAGRDSLDGHTRRMGRA